MPAARVVSSVACSLAVLSSCSGDELVSHLYSHEARDHAAKSTIEAAPETQSEGERVVYDLVANRVLAHRFVGDSWVADARAGHIDKSIPFGGGAWRVEQRGKRSVLRLASRSGSLSVPERAQALGPDRFGLLFGCEEVPS